MKLVVKLAIENIKKKQLKTGYGIEPQPLYALKNILSVQDKTILVTNGDEYD